MPHLTLRDEPRDTQSSTNTGVILMLSLSIITFCFQLMSRLSRHGTGSESRAPGAMNGDRVGRELEVTPSVPHLAITEFIFIPFCCVILCSYARLDNFRHSSPSYAYTDLLWELYIYEFSLREGRFLRHSFGDWE